VPTWSDQEAGRRDAGPREGHGREAQRASLGLGRKTPLGRDLESPQDPEQPRRQIDTPTIARTSSNQTTSKKCQYMAMFVTGS
jgi:hypothetical protein